MSESTNWRGDGVESYVYQAILTKGEDGAYDVSFPSLPGCFTCGDTLQEAAEMAIDAAMTYVAALLKDGLAVPGPQWREPSEGEIALAVAFSTDEDYVVEGEVVSAAEASRRLGVTPARVTHMLGSGILKGYRRGRQTYVTVASIAARLADGHSAGRPRKVVTA